MNKRRVVITGMGCVTPFGLGVNSLISGMRNRTPYTTDVSIRTSTDSQDIFPTGLVPEFNSDLDRTYIRGMGKMHIYAYEAVKEALKNAELLNPDNSIKGDSSRIGVSISSTLPSIGKYKEIIKIYSDNPRKVPASAIFPLMNNSIGLNIAKIFNTKGRVINCSGACASSIQSIILGYEAIQQGKADIMICGGTEEYSDLLVHSFHKMGIASKTNCNPFSVERDGIVISEGAGIVILEAEEIVNKRYNPFTKKASILGSCINNSTDEVFSDSADILNCMYNAMIDAEVDHIDILDTHATGTPKGDNEEAKAIYALSSIKEIRNVTALKGYFGHMMGASGAVELIATITANRNCYMFSTVNKNIDCRVPNLVTANNNASYLHNTVIMKNSFGLGGINTSLIIKT